MLRLGFLFAMVTTGSTAAADGYRNQWELGYCEETLIVDDTEDDCIGTRVYNHDGSFENAYCWQIQGCAPPYYGAFGEACDVGPATVECVLIWFTGIGYFPAIPPDVYVWSGGVSGPPAEVLAVIPFYNLNVPFWPSCGLNEIEMGCCVAGEFTTGCWFDFSLDQCQVLVCADENGPGGHPWTCIAPGIGYPGGWQHPNVVWPNCRSLGIGVTIMESPSPAESRTWGTIKSLFKQ